MCYSLMVGRTRYLFQKPVIVDFMEPSIIHRNRHNTGNLYATITYESTANHLGKTIRSGPVVDTICILQNLLKRECIGVGNFGYRARKGRGIVFGVV